ncbi:MAG: pyridoxal phosphate-dependent decarboxylase family protein [Candidatus Limnocylindrales bacterium]
MSQRRPRPEPRPSDLGRFAWHPEPELLGFTDPAESRATLEELGAASWAAALDYLYGEAMRRPIAPETYVELRRGLFGAEGQPAPAPTSPTTSAELLAEFQQRLGPYQFNASHPRSFAYFTPPSLPIAIVGELLAQWTNQSVDISHASPSSSLVEEEVVAWLREVVGFGPDSFGVLTSGGALANFMALVVARDIGLAAQRGSAEPPRGRSFQGVRAYASDQAHFSVARALDVLGFPADTLRVLPSDGRYRLTGATLAAAVAEDRAAGLHPWVVAAVAGSTNTGSVDRVGELADVAEREGLWLHVDAAYGGAVRLSAREAWRVPDLERADTITLDPHKWFYQPFDLGGLLVKRREDLRHTFDRSPEYYPSAGGDDEPLHWYQYSLEGTRRFRGLKLWLSWKSLGTEGFARLIEANLELAAYLARRIAESDDFEAEPREPELSVVCFRHLPGPDVAPDAAALDAHQVGLQRALEVSGDGWLSTTRLRGATWLRAGIVNYLATEADVDQLLATLRDLAATDGAAEA